MTLLSAARCVTLLLAASLAAQDAADTTSACTANIRWILPGNFAQALQRAVAENRMLLIKGISFGVDTAGATCATKGRW